LIGTNDKVFRNRLQKQEIARSQAEASDRSKVLQSLGKADDQLRRQLGESLPALAKFNWTL
jgi:hypothetical protein